MPLQYLIFDASDDGADTGTWEAMASVQAEQLPRLMGEVQQVLDWACAHSPGPRGPLDDGGVWDADVHTQQDGSRTQLTLTITGPLAWGEAMVAALSPD